MSVNKDPSGNGQWLVSVRYTDFQGKTKQKCKREFLKQSHTDLDMTLGSFVEIYSSDIMPRIKQNTWRTKETIIEKKLLPYFKDRKINEIKPQDIIKWQNAMLKKKGPQGEKLSPTYLNTIHNQLSAIFNHAVRFYELPSNPAQKTGNMGKEKSKEMLFWTKEEYLKFSESMMDKPISYYAFEKLYWCGLRMGELLALTKEDFDFTKSTVKINKSYQRIAREDIITDPKTPKSNRIISMPDFLCDEMKEYIDSLYKVKNTDRLF